jgi:hypothetical protein
MKTWHDDHDLDDLIILDDLDHATGSKSTMFDLKLEPYQIRITRRSDGTQLVHRFARHTRAMRAYTRLKSDVNIVEIALDDPDTGRYREPDECQQIDDAFRNLARIDRTMNRLNARHVPAK